MTLDLALPGSAGAVARWPEGGALFAVDDDAIVVSPTLPLIVDAGDDLPMRAAGRSRTLLSEDGVHLVAAALPFDGSVPAELVPMLEGEGEPPRVPGTAPEVAPVWQPEMPPDEYRAAVIEAVRRVRAGALEKVVLARSLAGPAPSHDALVRALIALRRRDPHAHLFAMPVPPTESLPHGVIAGASPELLVRRRGMSVLSRPLAGSVARSADPAADAAAAERLRHSAKDNAEHRFVVEAVADTLAPHCAELDVDRSPSLDATATVWHLASTVRGRLRDRDTTAIDLAAALHPTPAIGGTPRAAALHAISEIESVPRGFYGGCAGWVDRQGDGDWVVTLRCVEVRGATARLFAGGGIVAGSDPDAELAETDAKLATMLEAFAG